MKIKLYLPCGSEPALTENILKILNLELKSQIICIKSMTLNKIIKFIFRKVTLKCTSHYDIHFSYQSENHRRKSLKIIPLKK